MESARSEQCASWKTTKSPWQNVPYYVVQSVLVAAVTLPTIFYIFRPEHPSHSSFNETLLDKNEEMINKTSPRGIPLQCNSPLVFDQDNGQCRPPCNWTSQSTLIQRVYYGVVVTGFWLILIAAVITFITWVNIKNLRKFPHVLRFHIIVCCIILACCRMLPIRIGLGKSFCREELYWKPGGHSSYTVIISGATSHFFGLALSFWAMCFIANTYAVIIHRRKGVFKHPTRIHFIQSIVCWMGPAIIVVGCLYIAPPGYTFLFADLLAVGPASIQMAYFAVTLPMQVTLVVSLCLLWAIIWHLRKARLDRTKRVIRAREETESMRRVERQFLSMAVVMLLLVGVVLAANTVIIYSITSFYHNVEMYFHCLQTSTNCETPSYSIVLPLINVVAPGFLCLIFFSLLLMNKECREIWKAFFRKFSTIFKCCKPAAQGKLTSETDRSRSLTLITVLIDRRDSIPFTDNTNDAPRKLPTEKQSHPTPSQDQSRLLTIRDERLGSSNASFPVANRRKTLSAAEREFPVGFPSNELEGRSRRNSLPVVFVTKVKDSRVVSENDKNRRKSMGWYRNREDLQLTRQRNEYYKGPVSFVDRHQLGNAVEYDSNAGSPEESKVQDTWRK